MFPKQFLYTVIPFACVVLGDSLIYLILPLSPEEFGIKDYWGLKLGFWIGIALSINRFVRIFTNFLASKYYLKFGFKFPFIISIFIGSLTTISYGINENIIILLIARLFWGVCFSFQRLGVQLSAFEFGSDHKKARYLGFANASLRGGSLLSVVLGSLLIQITNIEITFTIFGLFGLFMMLIAILIPDFSISSISKANHEKDLNNRFKLISTGLLRFSSAFTANGILLATASVFVSKVLVNDNTLIGFQLTAITLGSFVLGLRWFADLFLSFIYGEISDKIGKNFVVNSCVIFMIIGCILLIYSTSSLELMFLSFLLLFFFSVGTDVSLESITGHLSGDSSRSIELSKFNTWADFGSAFGPFIGFIILGVSGFQLIFIISTTTIFLSWVIFLTGLKK
ncbi:MAG: hypothetical protein CL764_07375 [Chloroflexi bacterium]|nr:hypothetical protein [Chloroflexota bacterium]